MFKKWQKYFFCFTYSGSRLMGLWDIDKLIPKTDGISNYLQSKIRDKTWKSNLELVNQDKFYPIIRLIPLSVIPLSGVHSIAILKFMNTFAKFVESIFMQFLQKNMIRILKIVPFVYVTGWKFIKTRQHKSY